jgi:hypothetical protein
MECNHLDSSKLRMVSLDISRSGFAGRFGVEARPVPGPQRNVSNKTFTFFQQVDILGIIPNEATSIAEDSEELVCLGGVLDILNFLSKTGDEHVKY